MGFENPLPILLSPEFETNDRIVNRIDLHKWNYLLNSKASCHILLTVKDTGCDYDFVSVWI
jgi:hypothetical protein